MDHLQDNDVNDISTSDSEDETKNKRTLLNFIKKKTKASIVIYSYSYLIENKIQFNIVIDLVSIGQIFRSI